MDKGVRSTDAAESAAFSHKTDMIDIYSNSWGPLDNGYEVKGPGVLASRAIKLGIEQVMMRTLIKCEKGVLVMSF